MIEVADLDERFAGRHDRLAFAHALQDHAVDRGNTSIWMLATMVVAVRQALDYRRTARAVAVCGLGWVLILTITIVLGLAFGPPLS